MDYFVGTIYLSVSICCWYDTTAIQERGGVCRQFGCFGGNQSAERTDRTCDQSHWGCGYYYAYYDYYYCCCWINRNRSHRNVVTGSFGGIASESRDESLDCCRG